VYDTLQRMGLKSLEDTDSIATGLSPWQLRLL
jgi:hypothetical protein